MTTNSGITKEWVDETVKPGDDFFRHVNGKWLATHEIPADRPKDGGLYTLRDNAEKHVRELVEKIAKEQPESRIGALYNSFMDVEKIEADGLEPLLKEIAPILNSATPSHLAVTLALLSRAGLPQLFAWYTSNDPKDPKNYTFFLYQSGLGLPDESYYREEKHEQACAAYVEHIARMFELTGLAEGFGLTPEQAAQLVFTHESELARLHWNVVENRDAEATYNPYQATELDEKFPGFPFSQWLLALGADPETLGQVIVAQPSFFEGAA